MTVTKTDLAQTIDHTLLKPTVTRSDIKRLCQQAQDYQFAAVCVNPYYVPLAARLLKSSDVAVCTVIGFPLGANSTAVKVLETTTAVQNGAQEIDMVLNLGALLEGQTDIVLFDIQAVVQAAKDAAHKQNYHHDPVVKVIIETCFLNQTQKIQACHIIQQAGADFVKTSTGFGSAGATVEDITLLRQAVGNNFGVKASGGIQNTSAALALIKAGANRIGASAGVAILEGYEPAVKN